MKAILPESTGFQVGSVQKLLTCVGKRRAVPPPDGIVNNCGLPRISEVKTNWLPSGDQLGPDSKLWLRVSRLKFLPLASLTQSSVSPDPDITIAILEPSGLKRPPEFVPLYVAIG